ncbi:serine hydrolase domain-containing protein [Nannocystaceae bacterium ST9]
MADRRSLGWIAAGSLLALACVDSARGDDEVGDTGESATGESTSEETGTTQSDSSESTSATETTDTETTGETGDVWVYPEPDWLVEPPEDHGLSSEGLAAMATVAEGFDSNCLVVTQAGAIVGEWYWNDFGPESDQANVYSVSKSITSALVGIAVEQGELDIEAPVDILEWQGSESEAITTRHLISNDSGRQWSFDLDYLQLGFQSDQTQFAIELGQDHPIGTWWEYNNAAIQTLERVLGTSLGTDLGVFAEHELFAAIHMSSTMGRDAEGNPLTYQGVSASCRDLARFGYLYLRGGRWAGGVQVVPEAWVAESITPSTDLNSAYGFMWWLNRPGHWVLPSAPLRDEGEGQIAPQAPEEVFAAIGAFGQFIVVDPTSESVWVRLGPTDLADATGVGKLDDLWAAFDAAQLR